MLDAALVMLATFSQRRAMQTFFVQLDGVVFVNVVDVGDVGPWQLD